MFSVKTKVQGFL